MASLSVGYLFKKKYVTYQSEEYEIFEFIDYVVAIAFTNDQNKERCNIVSGINTGSYASVLNKNANEEEDFVFLYDDINKAIKANENSVNFVEIRKKRISNNVTSKYYLRNDSVVGLTPLVNNDLINFLENNSVKEKSGLDEEVFELDWDKLIPEISPYTILGIEEKEYSKEELLEIVENKINCIKNQEVSTLKTKQEIDKVLDAYNMIMQTSRSKK